MARITVLTVVLLVVGQGTLAAQLSPAPAAHARTVASSTNSLLSEIAQAELQQANSILSRIGRHALYTAGFSLVGSGFGYFASQVAYSDWDKTNNSTFASERRAFSLTGAAIGAVAGFVLGAREASGPLGSRLALHQELGGGDLILGVELENSNALMAYEAIQRLRPTWLLTRGTKSTAESATGSATGRDISITPGITTIKVYIDNAFMGDIDSLRTLPIATVRSMRRLDAAAATARWGSGHAHGAILIETVQD